MRVPHAGPWVLSSHGTTRDGRDLIGSAACAPLSMAARSGGSVGRCVPRAQRGALARGGELADAAEHAAGYAKRRPDLAVQGVNVTTILSDTSKDKNVDTAKANMVVGSPPERIEVDFMPTIGEETYEEVVSGVKRLSVRTTAERQGNSPRRLWNRVGDS